MNKSTLYKLAFVLIGLLLFIYSINSIKELLLYLALPIEKINNPSIKTILFLNLTIQWIIASILVFKTKFLLSLIKKSEQDTDTAISIFHSPYSLYKLGISLICIILIITNLPEFLTTIVKHIWSVQKDFTTNRFDLTLLATHGLRLLLAFILLLFSKQISLYLSKDNE